MTEVRSVGRAEMDALSEAARGSGRLRAHLLLHASHDDPVQRILIAIEPYSYVRPHRHTNKPELFVVLRGSVLILTFDESGRILQRLPLSAGSDGLGAGASVADIPPMTIHSVAATSDSTVILEAKAGPFLPPATRSTVPTTWTIPCL